MADRKKREEVRSKKWNKKREFREEANGKEGTKKSSERVIHYPSPIPGPEKSGTWNRNRPAV